MFSLAHLSVPVLRMSINPILDRCRKLYSRVYGPGTDPHIGMKRRGNMKSLPILIGSTCNQPVQ